MAVFSPHHLLLLIPCRLKDGREIQPSDNFTLQAEGGLRRLIIRSAEVADAGAYTCHCGDRSVEFDVNVRGMRGEEEGSRRRGGGEAGSTGEGGGEEEESRGVRGEEERRGGGERRRRVVWGVVKE